jgi:hypothetical protein
MAETNDESNGGMGPVAGGGLIDLSDTPLHELLRREDDAVLVQALQRVTTEASRQFEDAVSAFNSSIL